MSGQPNFLVVYWGASPITDEEGEHVSRVRSDILLEKLQRAHRKRFRDGSSSSCMLLSEAKKRCALLKGDQRPVVLLIFCHGVKNVNREDCLLFEDGSKTAHEVADALKEFKQKLAVVLFLACDSENVAKQVQKELNLPAVVFTKGTISQEVTDSFAERFLSSFLEGKTFKESFEETRNKKGIFCSFFCPVANFLKESYKKLRLDGFELENSMGMDDLQKTFIPLQLSNQKVDGTIFQDFFGEGQRVLLKGPAGSGKTTLLKYIAFEWAHGRLWKDKFDLVVRIRLKNSTMRSGFLLDCLVEELFGDEAMINNFRSVMDKGRTLWLIDGWDEITISEDSGFGKIAQGSFDKVQWLIAASRPESVNAFKQPLLVKEVQGFTKDSEDLFLSKFFKDDEIKREQVSTALATVEWLREACQLPLILRMVCCVPERLQQQTWTRSEIYNIVIKEMIISWKTKQGISAREEDVRKYLCGVAWKQFQTNDRLHIHRGDLEEPYTTCGLFKVNGKAEKAWYSWIHISFQEYLAAAYLCESKDILNNTTIFANIGHRLKDNILFLEFACGIGGNVFIVLEQWFGKDFLDYVKVLLPTVGASDSGNIERITSFLKFLPRLEVSDDVRKLLHLLCRQKLDELRLSTVWTNSNVLKSKMRLLKKLKRKQQQRYRKRNQPLNDDWNQNMKKQKEDIGI